MSKIEETITVNVNYPAQRPMIVLAQNAYEIMLCLDLETKSFVMVDCEHDAQERGGVMFHPTYEAAAKALAAEIALLTEEEETWNERKS